MNQDPQFTSKLQAWVNTPDSQKDWDEGALLLLQLTGNRIMYHNISINPKGKAEFIKGQLQKYLNFRLQKLTRDQVCQMQSEVDEIVKKVIKPAADSSTADAGKSEEFADFKAGKRPDHDDLPEEIQALYVENLDIVHRMRELHMKLRSLSLDNATCPDSERYPFLKEIISLDKKRVQNWDIYDHFIPGTPVTVEEPSPENEDSIESEPASDNTDKVSEASVNPADVSVNPKELTESSEQPAEEPATSEAKPKKKATTKRTTKKPAKK
ncbi:hypothetical protein M1D30_05115 [Prevotella sp. E15-22]|uniref:hypothetical protein n=1 Tax=Prevotella sp. E15-22 TaxID=2937774 RepID=UPI00206F6AEE|nr:hypothetical protein [Prevotella sp. E15-22]UPS45551.1 hypothetical protein M1D30_05115 [Prevotella sp. E15-22]